MTDREKQVVELICKGMKNKGIAEKLFITETTVRHHLTSVFNKLEVQSRLELVIFAFKHQLVKVPTNQPSFETNGGGGDSRSFHYV
jgi:DNA-binding NarL/FixJ family response regulator